MGQDLILRLVAIAAGIFTGGSFFIWFTKFMASRLIKQYDEKHAQHETRLKEIADKFSECITELKVKLAKLEPILASTILLREDLKSAEGEIAVLEHKVDQVLTRDVHQAHAEIRLMKAKLDALKN